MNVSGTGFTEFRCKIKPDFKPMTSLALKWIQTADGNWYATDRGVNADVYAARFRMIASAADSYTFHNAIEDNRLEDDNEITMDDFESDEHIFGANQTYTGGIVATVTSITPIKQRSLRYYEWEVEAQITSGGGVGAGSLPTLSHLDIGYTADSDWTINKYDSYYGTFSYLDHRSDVGLFKGNFLLSNTDMSNIRNYIATQRGNEISVPGINGVTYPWGPRGGTFPAKCKIIQWEDQGMRDQNYWKMSLTLAEVV